MDEAHENWLKLNIMEAHMVLLILRLREYAIRNVISNNFTISGNCLTKVVFPSEIVRSDCSFCNVSE